MANEKTAKPKTTKAPKKAAAPKKTPAKDSKPAAKAEFGSKSAFIKQQPRSLSAKQVVEAAAAKGITLSENLVYAVRGAAKGKSGGAKKTAAPVKAKTSAPTVKRPSSDSLEATLRNAIAELGLARSRIVFEEVTAAFSGG